ncbi:PTS transporter subunit EIIC [Spiroplasma endosymbiont of Anurida maritima]|uniref:PTS transporter subunit EIIC n=1 Tax=Spiroplasma endosymbiont of Anurida maritima TaxID=2967972 RepID=UPI0036D25548
MNTKNNLQQNVAKQDKMSPGKWFKSMGSKTMSNLSKMSKAFLLPIALLPIAGIFLAVGATIAAETADGSAAQIFGNVLNQMGNVAFANLPILFCISVAIAYTDDSGVAAITAVIGFAVFNGMHAGLLQQNADGTYNLLWWKDLSANLVTQNIGISSLSTGVFAAIFIGLIAAFCFNRFHKTKLPQAISFFSGTKLVPIITFVAVIPLSLLFTIIWPPIGIGLEWFGNKSGELPNGVDSLIFEIFERSLVPFGLHHVFYAPLWWSSAGGDVISAAEQALAANSAFKLENGEFLADHMEYIRSHFEGQAGDQFAMYAVLSNNILTFTDIEKMGLNLGRFQTGKFPFMMFGLPAAAVAMWLTVPKESRKQVMGIYFSAAFTSFLTGITEPIEYTFLFVAPWLFYGVHMPLAAISFFAMGALNVHVTQTISGGFIDLIVFGVIPFAKGTNFYHIFWIGPIMGAAYFFAFFFLIKWRNVGIPGRTEENAKLYTKADFRGKKSKSSAQEATIEKSRKIIEALGGNENITNVDSCASRLRVTVVDNTLVKKDDIIALGGCNGVLVKGTSVQAVYGGEQEVLKPHMKDLLKEAKKIKEAQLNTNN